jgi:hypothetical protein
MRPFYASRCGHFMGKVTREKIDSCLCFGAAEMSIQSQQGRGCLVRVHRAAKLDSAIPNLKLG